MDESSHFTECCHRLDINVSLTWRQTHTCINPHVNIFGVAVVLTDGQRFSGLLTDDRLRHVYYMLFRSQNSCMSQDKILHLTKSYSRQKKERDHAKCNFRRFYSLTKCKKMSKQYQEMIIFVLTVYIFLISFLQC